MYQNLQYYGFAGPLCAVDCRLSVAKCNVLYYICNSDGPWKPSIINQQPRGSGQGLWATANARIP